MAAIGHHTETSALSSIVGTTTTTTTTTIFISTRLSIVSCSGGSLRASGTSFGGGNECMLGNMEIVLKAWKQHISSK